MSNQQPPYGQPPYGGQPGYGQPGPPQQGQPPYQGQPPQQPPYQGRPPQQPPYQGQPPQQPYQQGRPPQQYPGQQQPPYQGQQPPYQGQQPGYPRQQPPQGYPGGQQQWGQPGQPQPQWGPPGGQRGKGNSKILLLAGGGLALVAIIGVVLALVFSGDDKKVEPSPQPTSQPSENVDQGIEVGEGVYVKPQPGYLRKELKDYKGVYLLKQGEAYFMVQAAKAEGETTASLLPALMAIEKKGVNSSTFKANEPKEVKPGPDDKTQVKVVTTQSYEAMSSGQSKSIPVVGFVSIIERNDGVITVVKVYGRKDKLKTLDPDATAMLKSVVASQ